MIMIQGVSQEVIEVVEVAVGEVVGEVVGGAAEMCQFLQGEQVTPELQDQLILHILGLQVMVQ